MGAGFHGGFGKTKGTNLETSNSNDVLTIKGTSPNNNIKSLINSYKYNKENGKFGIKGKNSQIIISNNPIKDSINFFNKISKSGIKKKLTNGKGQRVDFNDGTIITHRIVTSTKGSPAVDIRIIKRKKGEISAQKIHFIKED